MVKNLLPSCIRVGIYCYSTQAKACITIMLQRYTHKMRIHNEYSATVQSIRQSMSGLFLVEGIHRYCTREKFQISYNFFEFLD